MDTQLTIELSVNSKTRFSVLPQVQGKARGLLGGVIGLEDSHFTAEGSIILAECFELTCNEVHDGAFHEVSLCEEQANF